jgi:UPF0755 protein
MRRFFLIFLIAYSLLSGFALWYHAYLNTPAPGNGEVIVNIPRGNGVYEIGARLAAKGLLRDDIRYLILVYCTRLKGKLKAGEYSIPLGLTPQEVLQFLAQGNTLRHHLTIPEGLNVVQIAELFAQDGWIQRERFLGLVHDRSFMHSLGIDATSLEGYLFPETYTLVRYETNEVSLIRMMVARFQQVWQEVAPPASRAMSRHQFLTLASIVEKETGNATERPLIARVFLNRLTHKMRLQSDPTVIYGIRDLADNLTRADLKRETPYNTYVIPALPPGPICNPGRAALEAVAHPAVSEALYFVSKNDGTHIFSTNLADHNQAVQTFQRKQ